MILGYSPDPSIQKIICGSAGRDVVIAHDWRQVQKIVGKASCFVSHLDPLSEDILTSFRLLKARLTLVPVVVVVEQRADVAIKLRDVVIEELIWVPDLTQQLQRSVQHALSKARFNRIVTAIRANRRLRRVTHDFLTTALLARSPFCTVEDVAAVLEVNTKTIHNHWRESGIATAGFTPKMFLDWVILLHADSLRSSGLSWSDVTRSTGVHQRTLDRTAKRLTGRSLSALISSSSSTVDAEFSTRVLPTLFGMDIPELVNFSAICHYV